MEFCSTEHAPAAIGPYSQAVRAGGMLYTSGQIALTPSGELVQTSIEDETTQVFANLDAVLQAGGCARDQVARATVYLTDLTDFDAVNSIYSDYFGEHRPARACVQVAALPKGVRVEIDFVAVCT